MPEAPAKAKSPNWIKVALLVSMALNTALGGSLYSEDDVSDLCPPSPAPAPTAIQPATP